MSAELTEDLSFIKDVRGWPAYPFLPVKRAGMTKLTDENFGTVITDGRSPIPTVFMVSIFQLNNNTDFEKVKKIKYNSIEELLMEWVID